MTVKKMSNDKKKMMPDSFNEIRTDLQIQGWHQGRARELQLPRRRHLASPVGGNFGFSSEEIWQNNVRKHHFVVILGPLSEAPAPLSENFWRHRCANLTSVA